MSAHDALRATVLARMASLAAAGRRSVSPSQVAWHGERIDTGAVWRCMDAMWCEELLEQPGADTYALARRGVGQLRIGEVG